MEELTRIVSTGVGAIGFGGLAFLFIYWLRTGEFVSKGQIESEIDARQRAETRADRLETQLAENNKVLAQQIEINDRMSRIMDRLIGQRDWRDING